MAIFENNILNGFTVTNATYSKLLKTVAIQKRVLKSVVDPINPYDREIWVLIKYIFNRLQVLEMNYFDRLQNVGLRAKLVGNKSLIDIISSKQLSWYRSWYQVRRKITKEAQRKFSAKKHNKDR